MEWLLYYGYLDFKKKNFDNIPKKMLQLPVLVIVLLCLTFISMFAGLVILCLSENKWFVLIPLAVELLCNLVSSVYIERYQVCKSANNLEDFRQYCERIYKWLKSNSFSSKEDIQEIRNRLILHVEKAGQDSRYKSEKIDRWLQVFLIPIILAVLSSQINQQTDLVIVWGNALFFILLVPLIYVAIFGGKKALNFFSERKLNKARDFIDDLLGVLDTQFRNSDQTTAQIKKT